jgi:hypothetical protein
MKIILILLLTLTVYANTKQKMFKLYQDQKYTKACNLGFRHFNKNDKDEEYISLYAFSCLKADFIDRLSIPTAMLKFSKEARANSAYFSVIMMQKKLLYHSLIDGYDISNLNMPTTDHVLSKVFDFYTKLGKHKTKDLYIFKDKINKNLSYKLYIIKNERLSKMVIEELSDNKIIKKHLYW